MRSKASIGLVLALVASLACSFLQEMADIAEGLVEGLGETGGGAPVGGRVTDIEGTGINGVDVACGESTASSGDDGEFTLEMEPGMDQVVVFSRAGYVTCSRRVSVVEESPPYISVTMMMEADPLQLDAGAGGTVTGERGASIAAPAGAFVDPEGNTAAGEVDVYLTPYDPAISEEAWSYPGDLVGLTLDGEMIPLETFGVLDVTVRQGGEELQIREGETVDIAVPAPSWPEKAATAPVWIYDAQRGLWIESEHGEATYDSATDTYSASVGHLSPCNIDRALNPSCIRGTVWDAYNRPVSGALVTAGPSLFGNNPNGTLSRMYTQMDGSFCMTVEADSDVLVTVTTEDGRVAERMIRTPDIRCDTYDVFSPDCSRCFCVFIPFMLGSADGGESMGGGDCEITENPFAGTCAAELGELFTCFQPQGDCFYEINVMGALRGDYGQVVEFENGSRMDIDVNPFTEEAEVSVYGPDPLNEFCGTMGYEGTALSITTESGSTYAINVTSDGATEYVCPDGTASEPDPAQMEAMAECSGTQGGSPGGACRPRPGSYLSSCETDFDCDLGHTCCLLGFWYACIPSELCPQ
jgi:hypothetical protein